MISVCDCSAAEQVEIAREQLEHLYGQRFDTPLKYRDKLDARIRAWRRVLSYAQGQAARESGQHISRCAQMFASIPQV